MKVKVGDRIYDGRDVPIMVILTDRDKKNIDSMESEGTQFAQFPDEMSVDEMKQWMKDVPDEEED